MGTFFLVALADPGVAAAAARAPVQRAGWRRWGWALAAFAGVFTLAVHDVPHPPDGLWDGIYTGLKYWLGQHGVGRGGEPRQLLRRRAVRRSSGRRCCSARSARSSRCRRPTLLRVFLIWDFVLSLAVYSWAGEKFAWLVLHPLLPLRAAGRRRRCRRSGRRARALAASVGPRRRGVALVYVGFASLVGQRASTAPTRASCSSPRSPPSEVKKVADAGRRAGRSRGPGNRR